MQDWIPGIPRIPYRHGVGRPEFLVLHETGAWGGTDASNRAYEARTWRTAFVHDFVDWDSFINVANRDYIAWGAGPVANERAIHQELVRTRDKDKFVRSYHRFVQRAVENLKDYGLKPTRRGGLWTHHDVSRYLGGTSHTDPDAYLEYHGYTAEKLIEDIQRAYNGHPVHATADGLLELGERGTAVKSLQHKFKDLGYRLAVDGIYGDRTEKVVKHFQQSYGLAVDGIAGPKTQNKLNGVISMLEEEIKKLTNRVSDLEKHAQMKPSNPNELHEWGKQAWEWAKKNGVTDGTRPNTDITREEVVTMLYRQEVK